MQILKDEIRDTIVDAATGIFLDKGFHRASMQEIAQKASVSASNIYNYFRGKKELFDFIVAPAANAVTHIIRSVMAEEEQTGHGADEMIEVIASSLRQQLADRHREIVLLMHHSQGSSYAGYKDRLITLLQDHFIENLRDPSRQNELIFHIIANNFVEGVVEIARHYRDQDQAAESLRYFLTYHLSGMAPFL